MKSSQLLQTGSSVTPQICCTRPQTDRWPQTGFVKWHICDCTRPPQWLQAETCQPARRMWRVRFKIDIQPIGRHVIAQYDMAEYRLSFWRAASLLSEWVMLYPLKTGKRIAVKMVSSGRPAKCAQCQHIGQPVKVLLSSCGDKLRPNTSPIRVLRSCGAGAPCPLLIISGGAAIIGLRHFAIFLPTPKSPTPISRMA